MKQVMEGAVLLPIFPFRARAGAAPLKLKGQHDKYSYGGAFRARAGAAPLKPVRIACSKRLLAAHSAPARARPR